MLIVVVVACLLQPSGVGMRRGGEARGREGVAGAGDNNQGAMQGDEQGARNDEPRERARARGEGDDEVGGPGARQTRTSSLLPSALQRRIPHHHIICPPQKLPPVW